MENKNGEKVLVVLVGTIATVIGIILMYRVDAKIVGICFLAAAVCFFYSAIKSTMGK